MEVSCCFTMLEGMVHTLVFDQVRSIYISIVGASLRI